MKLQKVLIIHDQNKKLALHSWVLVYQQLHPIHLGNNCLLYNSEKCAQGKLDQ